MYVIMFHFLWLSTNWRKSKQANKAVWREVLIDLLKSERTQTGSHSRITEFTKIGQIFSRRAVSKPWYETEDKFRISQTVALSTLNSQQHKHNTNKIHLEANLEFYLSSNYQFLLVNTVVFLPTFVMAGDSSEDFETRSILTMSCANSSSCPSCPPVVVDSKMVLSLLGLSIISVFTIFGNTLVCVAFATNKRLRILTNFYVASLAISDVLVAVVNIPLWTYWRAIK